MRRALHWSLALWGGIAVLGGMLALPFWFVLTGSVKAPQEIIARVPTIFPQSFTTQHYEKLLAASDYAAYMLNSIVVAVASTAACSGPSSSTATSMASSLP